MTLMHLPGLAGLRPQIRNAVSWPYLNQVRGTGGTVFLFSFIMVKRQLEFLKVF